MFKYYRFFFSFFSRRLLTFITTYKCTVIIDIVYSGGFFFMRTPSSTLTLLYDAKIICMVRGKLIKSTYRWSRTANITSSRCTTQVLYKTHVFEIRISLSLSIYLFFIALPTSYLLPVHSWNFASFKIVQKNFRSINYLIILQILIYIYW